jgi:hypothetical protein
VPQRPGRAGQGGEVAEGFAHRDNLPSPPGSDDSPIRRGTGNDG